LISSPLSVNPMCWLPYHNLGLTYESQLRNAIGGFTPLLLISYILIFANRSELHAEFSTLYLLFPVQKFVYFWFVQTHRQGSQLASTLVQVYNLTKTIFIILRKSQQILNGTEKLKWGSLKISSSLHYGVNGHFILQLLLRVSQKKFFTAVFCIMFL